MLAGRDHGGVVIWDGRRWRNRSRRILAIVVVLTTQRRWAALAPLGDMRDLVSQEAIAGGGVGCVTAGAEDDVLVERVGAGTDRLGGAAGVVVVMHAHAVERQVEARFEARP